MDAVAVKVCKMDSETVERQNFLEEACKFGDYSNCQNYFIVASSFVTLHFTFCSYNATVSSRTYHCVDRNLHRKTCLDCDGIGAAWRSTALKNLKNLSHFHEILAV